jgi:4'-phosphopantetheinyl transferase
VHEAIEVWVTHLDVRRAVAPHVLAVLDDAERAAAGRFVRVEDARRFALRRAFARAVVAGRLRARPEALRFTRTPAGKPVLVRDRAPALEISMASSGEVALCAVAGAPLGVDVERIRPGFDWRPLAERFFAGRERELAERHGERGFFALWTMKEALVKARGGTLARHLASGPAIAPDDAGQATVDGVHIAPVEVGAGYAAALATTAGRPAAVRVVACEQERWTRLMRPPGPGSARRDP